MESDAKTKQPALDRRYWRSRVNAASTRQELVMIIFDLMDLLDRKRG